MNPVMAFGMKQDTILGIARTTHHPGDTIARIIREDIASAQSLGERYLNPILSTSADCGKLGALISVESRPGRSGGSWYQGPTI